jgi:orotate phosphoribosyltransferase
MIFNKDTAENSRIVLQINAIKLNPGNPFMGSGWKSPIYCDNRLILLTPTIRIPEMNFLKKTLKKSICIAMLPLEQGNGMLVAERWAYLIRAPRS